MVTGCSILILSSLLCLDPISRLFLAGFPVKIFVCITHLANVSYVPNLYCPLLFNHCTNI
jgi:hypothetical protein